MKIVFLFISIFSGTLLFAQQPFGGGTGESKDNAYQMWTKEHLIELSDSLDSDNYKPWSDLWHKDKHFSLMQNIDNITRYLGSFNAHFYGNGKTITVIGDMATPLFVGIDSTIENLILNGYSERAIGIVGSVAYRWNEYATALISRGRVFYCINNATIINPTEYNGASGIASYNYGTITHCLNNGNVSGVDMVAGILAQNLSVVSNCINTGKITGSEFIDNGYSGVGGIVARHQYINISNCINLGVVEGINYIGGVAGSSFSGRGGSPTIIANCINSGYIKGNKLVGGIVGKNDYFTVNVLPATLTNCVNTGVVEGEEDVGAIVGKE